MPRKTLFSVLAVLVVCSGFICRVAAQTTINFSSLAQAGGDATGVPLSAFHDVGSSYSQDGFTFTATDTPWGPQTLGAWKNRSSNHPLGGKKATCLTAYYAATRITVTTTAGPFDLISIELAQWGAGQGGGRGRFPVTFHGVRDGKEVATQTFQVRRLRGTPVLSTYRFKGFTNLTSVYVIAEGTFATGYGFQLNNMVVRSSAANQATNAGNSLSAKPFSRVYFVISPEPEIDSRIADNPRTLLATSSWCSAECTFSSW
jgi:hypothetical protein